MSDGDNEIRDGDGGKYSAVSELFDYIESFVFSVSVVMLLFTCVALRLCSVDGRSMEKTLEDGELLIIADINYTPEAGDIVVFNVIDASNPADSKPFVKRVIATAGHYIKIDFALGLVYVSEDGVFDESDIIDESSYLYLDDGRWDTHQTYEKYVPEGYIFVMGDNRNNSRDSRDGTVGLIDVRRVLGKALIRIYPFPAAGSVY